MSSVSTPKAPKPDHVPDHLVADWDFTNPPGGRENLLGAWKALHDGPDIIWTPYHGGHWILTRAADIEFAQKNHDPFSMARILIPEHDAERPPLIPIELDPPIHSQYRTIVNRFFTPSAIKELQTAARAIAIELIEGFAPDGRCNFVTDFALKMPIIVFMKMVDRPLDNLDQLLAWTEMTARPEKPEDRAAAYAAMNGYLQGVIEERRAKPGQDLLSAVVHAQINGEPILPGNLLNMLNVIMFGGLDTVASSLGFAAHYLACNPEKREQLVTTPALIPNAADEMLRMFPPPSTGRIMTRDFELNGVSFKKGDRVLVRSLLHGMDDRKFPSPTEADWGREALERNFATFGFGAHRCPGASLARSEMRIFLEEWLKRIPNFKIDPNDAAIFGSGMINAVLHLPLTWDPAEVISVPA